MKFSEIRQDQTFQISVDAKTLSPAQVRLIKKINSLLLLVSQTNEEGDFFEMSADLMKSVASLVQQANFNQLNNEESIPYADQAVEFSVDCVQEALKLKRIITYDN